jgi:hypothetical protein
MHPPPESPKSPTSQTERETEELAERFFSQPPQAWEADVDHDAWRPAPLNETERLAMLATLAPVVIGAAVAAGLFMFSDPLFASAEAGEPARATSAMHGERPSVAPTQYGRTALAKAAVIEPTTATAIPTATATAMPTASAAPVEAAAHTPTAPPPRAAVARSAGSPLSRARRALDAGKPHEARTLATEAIGRNPTGAAAYIVLAGALDALGDRAGMQATFRSCAERATDSLAAACRSLLR